jgi:predicted transcriptional regulator
MFGYLIKHSFSYAVMGRAESETLQILRKNGEAFQSDIMRATGYSRGTLSEVLASLEDRRMIRRVTFGRSSKIVLVSGGRKPGRRLRLGFTRAAEYPFLVPLRRAMKEDGVALEFNIYDNGVSVARDLAMLRIDVGIAPILTLFMSYSLEAPFKIIGPAGSGGSSVLSSPKRATASHDGTRAVCTKMSTMELLMRSAVNYHMIPDLDELTYAASPEEISRRLISGYADVCSIWEPYATMLEAKGAKRVLRYSDISDHVCCAVAAGNHLGHTLLSRFSKNYSESLDVFRRDREASTTAYAVLAGLDSSTVRRVSKEYTYPLDLSSDSVVNQLDAAGMAVPAPSSFKESIFRE